jgi:L-ascorbate peroxidase
MHPSFLLTSEFLTEYFEEMLVAVVVLFITMSIVGYLTQRKTPEEKLRRALDRCSHDIITLLENTNAHPLLLRLAWSDACNYDKTIFLWPFCGGVNGSIHFPSELSEHANAGLQSAIELLIPLKKKYHHMSWADLIQMSGALAVEYCGGPHIPIIYGRVDVPIDLRDLDDYEMHQFAQKWAPGRALVVDAEDIKNRPLPQPFGPYPWGESMPAQHIKILANRLGFSHPEMIALMGAHTIGRGFKERSGVCPYFAGEQGGTQYTKLTSLAKGDKPAEVGLSGG